MRICFGGVDLSLFVAIAAQWLLSLNPFEAILAVWMVLIALRWISCLLFPVSNGERIRERLASEKAEILRLGFVALLVSAFTVFKLGTDPNLISSILQVGSLFFMSELIILMLWLIWSQRSLVKSGW